MCTSTVMPKRIGRTDTWAVVGAVLPFPQAFQLVEALADLPRRPVCAVLLYEPAAGVCNDPIEQPSLPLEPCDHVSVEAAHTGANPSLPSSTDGSRDRSTSTVRR